MPRKVKAAKTISIVVSAYNEEATIPKFYDAITEELSFLPYYELLFVNDGSKDNTLNIIRELAEKDDKVHCVSFSRNFGHEAAMIAGIDHASGDYIICMDADLQHPVSCIPQILAAFAEGADIVSMVRKSNPSAGKFKNFASESFYKLMSKLSDSKMQQNASDFFGLSPRAATVVKDNFRERVRFIRGYVQNIGFKQVLIEYDAAERAGGESKYSIKKLFDLSFHTIVCFSDAPLKLGVYAGSFATLLGIIMTVYTIITWAVRGAPSGYATIVVLMSFMFAVLFFILGIMGEYISVLFTEVKGRPVYIVEETF